MKINRVRAFIGLLLLNMCAGMAWGQEKTAKAASADSSVSVICEQGLFFINTGNAIYGAVSFAPETGSCAFVFKGKKTGKGQYAISCADYGDDELKSGKLSYTIGGRLTVSAEEVKITLAKDPDRCGTAFGASFKQGMAFDIVSVKKGFLKDVGIIRQDVTVLANKAKVKIYANAIVQITSKGTGTVSFIYHDDLEDKDVSGTVDKSKVLCIME